MGFVAGVRIPYREDDPAYRHAPPEPLIVALSHRCRVVWWFRLPGFACVLIGLLALAGSPAMLGGAVFGWITGYRSVEVGLGQVARRQGRNSGYLSGLTVVGASDDERRPLAAQ